MADRNRRYYEKNREKILAYQREKQKEYRESIKDDPEKIEKRRQQQRECKERQRQRKVKALLDDFAERNPELLAQINALRMIPTLTEHQAHKAIASFKSE